MDGEELGLLGGDEGGGAEATDDLGGDSGEEVEAGQGESQGEAEGQESGEGEESGEGGRPGEERTAAARALPGDIRRALRELNAANPDFAKKYPQLERRLTAALYKAGQADKLGGLQNLRAAAEFVETHGGTEAVQRMAEEIEAGRTMEDGFRSGDPVLIDTWAKEYPDGFKALVGPAIDKLEAVDLAAHDRALAMPMFRALDRTGVLATVNALENAISGERFEDIGRHFGELKQFLLDLRNFATRAKAPDPLKGERDQLENERAEMQTERTREFYGRIRNDVNGQMMAAINRLLRQELAGKKISVNVGNRLRKAINEELSSQVNTAPGYADKYKAVMGQGNHDRAVRFIIAAARAKAPAVVKKLVREFNLAGTGSTSSGTARRPMAAGAARSGTGRTVVGRPKTSEVDFTRTDKAAWLGSMTLGHGQAYLKDGRVAKW